MDIWVRQSVGHRVIGSAILAGPGHGSLTVFDQIDLSPIKIFNVFVFRTTGSHLARSPGRKFGTLVPVQNLGANYKKILRLSYDVIITYDNRKSNLR